MIYSPVMNVPGHKWEKGGVAGNTYQPEGLAESGPKREVKWDPGGYKCLGTPH